MATPPQKPPSPPKSGGSPSAFTLDKDTTGMNVPSVTQLLNRKSFTQEIEKGKLKAAAGLAPPPAPGPTQGAPVAPGATRSVTQLPSPAEAGGKHFKTASAPEREQGLLTLKHWSDVDIAQLPGGAGLLTLFQEGQKLNLWSRTLILQAQPGSDPAHTDYKAISAWGPSDAALLWDGITFRGATFPVNWGQLLRAGFFELPAGNAQTNADPESRVLRQALGAGDQESVLGIRLGNPQAPWGVAIWLTNEGMGSKVPAKNLGTWAQKGIQEAAKIAPPPTN